MGRILNLVSNASSQTQVRAVGGPRNGRCVTNAWKLSQGRGSGSLCPNAPPAPHAPCSARLSPRAHSPWRRTQEGTVASLCPRLWF